MTRHNPPKARSIWLLLMALSLFSTFVAEGSDHATYAIITIFVIAAAKGDLVVMHYMEAGRAEPHWQFMYRAWLAVVTVLLISGHIWAG
jgi:heme/copper-type cytochrome/quinol oxidase subunit 4